MLEININHQRYSWGQNRVSDFQVHSIYFRLRSGHVLHLMFAFISNSTVSFDLSCWNIQFYPSINHLADGLGLSWRIMILYYSIHFMQCISSAGIKTAPEHGGSMMLPPHLTFGTVFALYLCLLWPDFPTKGFFFVIVVS